MSTMYEESKDYFVDDSELIDDILLEDANDEDVCRSLIGIAFIHLIKYEIIRYKQDTSWIVSIKKVLNNFDDINSLKSGAIRRINNDIDKLYASSRKAAKSELKKKGYKEANLVCSVDRPDHYNLEFLFDEAKIDEYLMSISLTREVRDYYHLPSKLTKSEEELLYKRIPLDKAFPGVK